MTKYDEHFKKVSHFINTYVELINCHLVDFITERLWEKSLPYSLRMEFEDNKINSNHWIENDDYPELNNFIKLTKSLSLQSCSTVEDLKDLAEILPEKTCWHKYKYNTTQKEFMNTKKFHEVEVLGNIIGTVATSTGNLVIDAGAGKAYLSTFLAENHEIPVLAIDSSRVCHKGALCRQEKLRKKTRSQSLVQYVVQEINNETDYVKLVKHNFSEWNSEKKLIITGLHTCGSLPHSIIRAFLRTRHIHFLCIVPCCYHLTNETLDHKNNFSKNARMLAQQSVERSSKNQSVPPSLFYRAVLQVILHSLGIYNSKIGRGGPLNNFASYAKWALLKIGVEIEKVPSVDDLENIYQSYVYLKNKFDIFQMLRIHVGPVLEAAIMLDKIIFLKNSNQCSKLAILSLFDPLLSPRHYGIVAMK